MPFEHPAARYYPSCEKAILLPTFTTYKYNIYVKLGLGFAVWNLCEIYRDCKSIKLIKSSFVHAVARYSPSYEKATVTPIT